MGVLSAGTLNLLLTFDEDARRGLLTGVSKLSRAVSSTQGPRGRNAVLDKGWGAPKVTKDGVTVAEDIELEDPYENVGVQLVKEAAAKISDLLRDEFAARSATSAVIHGAFRNPCPPSSPVRVAAIVAALLVQPYKTFEFGFLASLPEFQILISDLLNNLVTNSLEKDRVDSRVLVDAPFLQIVRSEGPPVE